MPSLLEESNPVCTIFKRVVLCQRSRHDDRECHVLETLVWTTGRGRSHWGPCMSVPQGRRACWEVVQDSGQIETVGSVWEFEVR